LFTTNIIHEPGYLSQYSHGVKGWTALGTTQPPIQWVPRALSTGIKWSGREADHSSSPSAQAKNGGTVPPLPIRLYGAVINYSSTGIFLPLLLLIFFSRCHFTWGLSTYLETYILTNIGQIENISNKVLLLMRLIFCIMCFIRCPSDSTYETFVLLVLLGKGTKNAGVKRASPPLRPVEIHETIRSVLV
jgi:hypothetical protein